MNENLLARARALQPWLTEIRRTLHRIPEPGNAEHETSAFLSSQLDSLGIPHTRIGTGIVARLEGTAVPELAGAKGSRRVVALRADMDALPIQEPPDRPYASLHPGCMHACGHDAHMTIALGAARILASMRGSLPGTVVFIFQPAEETSGGAKPLIEAGCLENPHVDLVLGLHVVPELPAGRVEVRYGPFYGASDLLEIRIQGKNAHAAYPEQGVDAIVAASAVVQGLQSVVSRNVSALESAVVSIGTIQGGTVNNIIAREVVMKGTIRTLSEEVRERVRARVRELTRGIAASYGAESEVTITPGYPVLINHDLAVDLVAQTARSLLGPDAVTIREKPTLGVEDFAWYLKERPGAFWHLGCGPSSPLHSPQFDIDESCLPIGVAVQTAAVFSYLGN